MKFIAKTAFSSSRWGNVKVGDSIDVDGGIARSMVDAGVIELSSIEAQKLRDAEAQRLIDEAGKAKSKIKLDV